ncbi:MAG: DNA-processing protein DprA, partial [Bacteroidota bacterium]
MEPYDVRDLLTLLTIPRVGPIRLRALLERFQDPARILAAAPRELARVRGIDRATAVLIARASPENSFVTSQLCRLKSMGADLIPYWDPRYPPLLGRIYDPPSVLFVLGELTGADHEAVAVIGTRRPSIYGERVTADLARGLVEHSLTVVSGLARGIDTVAHAAALDAGGRTIAVLGSGLDVAYPPENAGLQRRIAAGGAVISEFMMGTKPDATNFPRRNRVVSGLSLGAVRVESGLDGGAMITAASALDQNREVFAVPGSILDARSTGPHALIRDGRAKLISGIDDILVELRLDRPNAVAASPLPMPALTLFERTVVD